MRYSHCSFLVLFLFFINPLSADDSTCQPSQIHLSLGDSYYKVSQPSSSALLNNNQAYLTWHSQALCTYSINVFDKNTRKLVLNTPTAFYRDFLFDFTNQNYAKSTGTYHTFSYTALLTGLSYETLYQYSILDSNQQILSGPYTFRMTSPNMKEINKKIILIGDIDASPTGLQTINKVNSLVENNFGDYAGIIQLGDIAYDIQDDNGEKGDNFFNVIQNITTQWPFTMVLGNHDAYQSWSFINLRIRNPLFNATQNHYYSFNWEGIHFTVTNFDFYDTASTDIKNKMLTWAEEDLKRANTKEMRALYPFVVFIVHRPIYCSYAEQSSEIPASKWCYSFYEKRKAWDELLYKYSVDLVLTADKHSYERMGPLYQNKSMSYQTKSGDQGHNYIIDPKSPVYILDGAGGQEYFTPQPYSPSGYTFVADVRASYDVLYIQNNTNNISLIFEHYLSETGDKLDYMYLVKTKVTTDGGNGFVVVIAILIILGVAVAGYIYWKRRQEQESQRGNYLLGNEREVPLVVLKE